MSLEEYINLCKMNKRCKFLLGAVAGAAILHSVKKCMCCNSFLPEALKSFSTPFKHRQALPKIKSIILTGGLLLSGMTPLYGLN